MKKRKEQITDTRIAHREDAPKACDAATLSAEKVEQLNAEKHTAWLEQKKRGDRERRAHAVGLHADKQTRLGLRGSMASDELVAYNDEADIAEKYRMNDMRPEWTPEQRRERVKAFSEFMAANPDIGKGECGEAYIAFAHPKKLDGDTFPKGDSFRSQYRRDVKWLRENDPDFLIKVGAD